MFSLSAVMQQRVAKTRGGRWWIFLSSRQNNEYDPAGTQITP